MLAGGFDTEHTTVALRGIREDMETARSHVTQVQTNIMRLMFAANCLAQHMEHLQRRLNDIVQANIERYIERGSR